MSDMENEKKSSMIMTGVAASEQTQVITERTFRIFSDANHLSHLAEKWKNTPQLQSQGHLFEQLETMKFNYDALQKDSDLYAKTTAGMGLPHDPSDINIYDGVKKVREVQAKSCNTAARSAFALSNEKYAEMQRLAPKEQTQKIKELLDSRIEAGTLKAEDYEQTRRNLVESLRHGKVASEGTTYQEALDATNKEVADDIAQNYKIKSALTDMHKSGIKAGTIGGAVGVGFSVLKDGYALTQGEQELGETIVNVTVSGAKGFATGYTATALSKGITHSASHYLGEHVARGLSRANAPIAIAYGVLNAGKSIVSYLKGDIDAGRLTEEMSHTVITGTSCFYYGALGQMAIPIPVVGAIIGSGVGYFVGNMIHQSGLIALGDSAVVKAAKERRRAVEAMCLAAIPQIQKNRQELEEKLDRYFSDRRTTFLAAVDEMDQAMLEWDPDKYVLGLNKINEQFWTVLPFQNFAEFDEFMLSDEALDF